MRNKKQILFNLCLLISFQLFTAQFTITNPLNSTDASGVRIGDMAYLTATKGVDPNGQGYLRLTDATSNQKGYFYVTTSFPSTLGIIADFEYKTWRNTADNTYFGADGFSIFLFDGSTLDSNFKLGGYGGSLGYATYSNPAGTTGLSGGYVGIGFDEYGNYAANTENRNGGLGSVLPNAVVLRGPTSSTYNLSNPYLTSTPLGDRTGTANVIRQRNEIDYNTTTTTRPDNATFYRRVQVIITKSGGDYILNVQWRKDPQTTFTNILSYPLSAATYPIPALLKLGFAASTGGGFNFHEIRNILLTTPGNLRVDSRVNNSTVCKEKKTNLVYNIEVTNDTSANLNSINFTNRLVDKNGLTLTTDQFKITSITTTGFTTSTIPTTNSTNSTSGVVGILANSSGIVTVTGDYYPNALKTNDKFYSTSTVDTTQITDTDLTNNIASSEVIVRKCFIISNPSLPAHSK